MLQCLFKKEKLRFSMISHSRRNLKSPCSEIRKQFAVSVLPSRLMPLNIIFLKFLFGSGSINILMLVSIIPPCAEPFSLLHFKAELQDPLSVGRQSCLFLSCQLERDFRHPTNLVLLLCLMCSGGLDDSQYFSPFNVNCMNCYTPTGDTSP